MTDVPPGSVQSVGRALSLLELLAQAGGRLPISELARRSGLPLGTVHRLLATLAARGYVRRDAERRYALGAALVPLGDAATQLLGSGALPFLAELAHECGETTNLAVLDGDHVSYIAQAPGRHRMRMFTEVGRRVLPHSTAVGKVLLAGVGEERLRRLVARVELPARTPHTLTTLPALLEELSAVRERGWAVDDEEEELGVRCLAVPVRGEGVAAAAALSVSAPASRLERDDAEVLSALRRVAESLAAHLGGG